jgi:hypothetical protein
MGHILENKKKKLTESIKLPIVREYPDEELVKFPRIVIHFYGRG